MNYVKIQYDICGCGRDKFAESQFCSECFLNVGTAGGPNVSVDNQLDKVEGKKFDTDKVMVELLPIESLEEIAKVMTFGAKKYNAENWRAGIKWKRVLGAAMRHLMAFMRGENKDPESGLSHLAHLGCCVMFLLWYEQHRNGFDDRYVDQERPTK
jgi:hypothetical protein